MRKWLLTLRHNAEMYSDKLSVCFLIGVNGEYLSKPGQH